MKTNELVVVGINWDAITVAVNGENKRLTWAELRAAATQDDSDLRTVYAGVLDEAKQIAKGKKAVRVEAKNLNGHVTDTAALTWAAVLSDMAGEHVSSRVVAADWGQTGSYSQATKEVDEAGKALAKKGYEVY